MPVGLTPSDPDFNFEKIQARGRSSHIGAGAPTEAGKTINARTAAAETPTSRRSSFIESAKNCFKRILGKETPTTPVSTPPSTPRGSSIDKDKLPPTQKKASAQAVKCLFNAKEAEGMTGKAGKLLLGEQESTRFRGVGAGAGAGVSGARERMQTKIQEFEQEKIKAEQEKAKTAQDKNEFLTLLDSKQAGADWMETFLANPLGHKAVEQYCQTNFNTENIRFLDTLKKFDQNPTKEGFEEIMARFITGDEQINLNSQKFKELSDVAKDGNRTSYEGVFNNAKKEILSLLTVNTNSEILKKSLGESLQKEEASKLKS